MKAILTALFFSAIMIVKWILAKIFYPVAYLAKDWVYGNDVVKNYTIPLGVQHNLLKWYLWLFLDDDQPKGYSERYLLGIGKELPITKCEKFKAAYSWSAWRNPMYNVNYVYFGNRSEIVSHKVVFGKYEWNRKLRASNGDNGAQLVMYTTAKGQERFLLSAATNNLFWLKIPFTMFYGWNADYNGRITVALKFK